MLNIHVEVVYISTLAEKIHGQNLAMVEKRKARKSEKRKVYTEVHNMGRTIDDIRDDIKMLNKLHIGDRVQYISKSGVVKTGIISKFTEYKGRYRSYSSVTVVVDGGNSHIIVSLRNLELIKNACTED